MKRPTTYAIDETTLVFAFRYALGRQSTAPGHVASQLKQHWPKLNTWTRQQIQDEIKTAIRLGDAGRDCDIATWSEVLTWQAEPPFLWRKDDGERFTRNAEGHYTMDSSQMGSPYHYTYEALMSHNGAFVEQKPRKALDRRAQPV